MEITIITLENDIGNVLRSKCSSILKSDNQAITMLHNMRKWVSTNENKALGLALPQIGIAKQGFVFYSRLTERVEIAINPKILRKSEYGPSDEGCLSMPGVDGVVSRAKEIEVMYQMPNMKWKKEVLRKRTACVFQHEYDHLQGVLFRDLPQLVAEMVES